MKIQQAAVDAAYPQESSKAPQAWKKLLSWAERIHLAAWILKLAALWLALIFCASFLLLISQYTTQHWILIWALPVFLAAFALVFRVFSPHLEAVSTRRFLLASTALFLITRLAAIIAIPAVPVIDFKTFDTIAHWIAAFRPVPGIVPMALYQSTWGYPLFLGLWYAVFGDSLFLALVFNVLAGLAALLLLHRFTERAAGKLAARVSVILFLLWPAQLLMSSILVSEHLSTAFGLLGAVLLQSGLQSDQKNTKALIGSGLAFGAAFVVRTAMIAALPAVVLVLFLGKDRWMEKMKHVALLVAAFLGIYLLYLSGMKAVYKITPVSSPWFPLMVGSNFDSGGYWNQTDSENYFTHQNFPEADVYAREQIVQRIFQHPRAYLHLMSLKATSLWSGATYGSSWSMFQMKDTPVSTWMTANISKIRITEQTFHIIFLVTTLLGLYRLFRKPASAWLALALGFLVVGTGMILISEVQPRYTFVMVPFALAIAGYGLVETFARPVATASQAPIEGHPLS